MAFVVKNTSNMIGSAEIDGKWVDIAPGRRLEIAKPPKKRTSNLVCFEISKPSKAEKVSSDNLNPQGVSPVKPVDIQAGKVINESEEGKK